MTVSANAQETTVSAHDQKTMRRVVVARYGGPDVLRVVEDDVPQPGPGEVLVRVLAAGVSYTDAMLRAGAACERSGGGCRVWS